MVEIPIYSGVNPTSSAAIIKGVGDLITTVVRVPGRQYRPREAFCVGVPSEEFMRRLAVARLGDKCSIQGANGVVEIRADRLDFYDENADDASSYVHTYDLRDAFDGVYLDAFSVAENRELSKRSARHVNITAVERCLLDILREDPEKIDMLQPREFEVLVGTLLADRGFSRVKITRFSKDQGVDLMAVYYEGQAEHTVVVEIKKRSNRSVGIEIVDRLNGVRARHGAMKALLVTNSSVSVDARRAYSAHSSTMAMVDFERLKEILLRSPVDWKSTPSGLWSMPLPKDEVLRADGE